MKKRRNNSDHASTLPIALSTGLISISAILLAIAAPTNTEKAPRQDLYGSHLDEGAADSTTALGNYPDTSIPLSANTTVTPDAAPTNTTSINVSTNTNFKGTFAASPTTGVVRVTDAHPADTYLVTVMAFGPGGTTTKTFNLTVTSTPCEFDSFANAADVSVGAAPYSVVIEDFNGDGRQDLAVTNRVSNTISIRLGDGLGGFGGSTEVSVGSAPHSMAIGDFNGDGRQDLAVAVFNPNAVSILLGDGLGGFGSSTNVSVNFALSLAIGDFNGDGRQDLAVGNENSGSTAPVYIRLGDGLGGFSGSTSVSVGLRPSSLAIGDFNGDSKQDFATTGTTTSNASIRLGDGLGGFSGSTEVNVGGGPESVVIGDFNGDGKQDFATTGIKTSNVSIRLGDGLGGFSGSTEVSVGSFPFSVAIGDFNGDGKQDFAVANRGSNTVSIRLGDGLGGFGGSTEVSVGSAPHSMAIGDFNGDGKQDFATANEDSNTVSIRLGQCISGPTPTPTPTPIDSPTPTATVPTSTPTPTPFFVRLLWEGFDAVTAPALPPGWVPSSTLGPANCTPTGTCALGTQWVTHAGVSQTAPNAAFHDDPSCVTDSNLDTPSLFIPVTDFPVVMNFWHNYNLEAGHDGGVVEISIDGGPFTDIEAAGGNADYNGTISTEFLSPIAGRQAWTGNVGGFVNTSVSLPLATGGHNVVLRFRLATDCSGAGVGWYVDSISISYFVSDASPTPTPTATPTPTPTPTATPTPTLTPTPTPSPTPAAQALNLSTRMRVQTGDNVGIGGFIITGTVPKQVLLRGVGASTVPGALADPVLELHGPPGFVTIINDNCDPGFIGSTFCLPGSLDAMIEANLDPGAYTAIVRGNNNTSGVALVEVYDVNYGVDSKLANISTRAFVSTADDIVIAGFILGGNTGNDNVILRGIGPSLAALGVPNVLADPTLELRDSNGALLIGNNDWQDDPIQAALIIAAGLAPTNSSESAIASTLPPGLYTVLLNGLNNGMGVGLVEVYDRGTP